MVTIPVRGILRLIVVLIVATLLVSGTKAYAEGDWPFCCDQSRWTGVFLTNGQAYFGHFYEAPGDRIKLDEVYYVLATQLQSQDPRNPPQTQLSLQRLGGEIHGPQQTMWIYKTQILFLEDLRSDSPVVRSIAQLKQGGTQPPAPSSSGAPATGAPTPTASPSPTR